MLQVPLKLLAGFCKGRAQQCTVFRAQYHIFKNAKVLHQFEVLKHHADTRRNRSLAVWNLGLFARNKYLAGVGLIEPVKDRHQR